MSEFVIKVVLTKPELDATLNIMKELHDVDFFNNLSFDCFTALEAFLSAAMKALDTETKNELIRRRLDERIKWADDRCQCGHTAEQHASAGLGLCCAEGCPSCFEFKKMAKK